MTLTHTRTHMLRALTLAMTLLIGMVLFPRTAMAQDQVAAFRQSVATAAADDKVLAEFYRRRNYASLWTGEGDTARRRALVMALLMAEDHGLPAQRYDRDGLMALMAAARTAKDRGAVEVRLSRTFLRFARDLQTGVLRPSSVDSSIVRDVPYRDPMAYLMTFEAGNPAGFFRDLAPRSNEYARLIKEKMRLEATVRSSGWGAVVPAKSLKPGDSGAGVVALRDRLFAMGYLGRSATQTYDAAIQGAVQAFQEAHGLTTDGTAGTGTIAQINIDPQERLKSVLVAMERERWLNQPRGKRHVLVNLTDFSAKIVDNDVVTFETRSVIGSADAAKQTPEFSETMKYIEINPDWTVPTGIIQRDYLPALQRNPNALSHLQVVDARGNVVPRAQIDFSRYTARSFPFNLRQPPSRNNALGTVKFMFPNPHAIYLHDTPDRSLFGREVRAYSNGCIRLNDPHDFAYALLARQEADPKTFFQRILKSGKQTRVNLKEPVPVHLIYRTAFTSAKGKMQYRRDIYGRDARIWAALAREGVALRAVRG